MGCVPCRKQQHTTSGADALPLRRSLSRSPTRQEALCGRYKKERTPCMQPRMQPRMQPPLHHWFRALRFNVHQLGAMVGSIQGITRDRHGKRYWRCVEEYAPGHFMISMYAWPGLTSASTRQRCVGWVLVGAHPDDTTWTMYGVRVHRHMWRQKGIGTALVLAAIQLAQQQNGSRLEGLVTCTHAAHSPFLLAWYEKRGFTVEVGPKGNVAAIFWMNLHTPAVPVTAPSSS